jgi:predicted transcriptional regulator
MSDTRNTTETDRDLDARLSVRASRSLKAEVQRHARKAKVPTAVWIRRAVRAYAARSK